MYGYSMYKGYYFKFFYTTRYETILINISHTFTFDDFLANIIKTKNITVINIQIKYFCFYLSNIIIHEILEINVNFIKKIQLYKLN